MRAIPKSVLMQKLQENPNGYVSKLKFLYWLSVYGQNIEVEEEDDE